MRQSLYHARSDPADGSVDRTKGQMHKRSSDGRGRRGGGARSWLLTVIALVLLSSVAVAVAQPASGGKADTHRLRKCLGQAATMVAIPGGGKLLGTRQQDVIVGSDTDDRIDGGGGDDLICAGKGDDVVLGSAGDDKLIGGGGNDVLRGGGGNDRCVGGAGNNKLIGCEKAAHAAPATQRVNRVPLARDVTGSTDEDSATSIDAAAVASDADGDALTFASLDTSASSGTAAIINGGARVRFDPNGHLIASVSGKRRRTASVTWSTTVTAAPPAPR